MKDGWYLRKKLGNKNVPSGTNVTGSLIKMGVIDTFYNVKGKFYRVGSLPYEIPQEIIGHQAYV